MELYDNKLIKDLIVIFNNKVDTWRLENNSTNFKEIEEVFEMFVDEIMKEKFGKKYVMKDSNTKEFVCYGILTSYSYQVAKGLSQESAND